MPSPSSLFHVFSRVSLLVLIVLTGGGFCCAVSARDIGYLPPACQLQKDTVYVPTPVPSAQERAASKPSKPYTEGKKMLFALRTNMLAIPLANVGVEVPLGRHFSLGADYYYPWIWRPHHAEGLDYSGSSTELLALDVETRYWFPRAKSTPSQRLLGHSIGAYAAVGYYDFERNASGYQGEFYNIGLDYLFAVPLWEGLLHLEFELGVGYIRSVARPYDNYQEGGKCFRRPGVQQYVNWWGPTRAQLSLVVPLYVRKKGGAR